MVDLETTGLGADAEVVEIGAVDLDCHSGEICPFAAQLVRPQNAIPPEVSAVHHITNADVYDA
ncbi:MAG: exonuclease domain-containing protein, partial [Pseudolabrys sp.]